MWKDSSSIGACVIGRASVVKVHCVMLMRFITGLKCVSLCVCGGGGEVSCGIVIVQFGRWTRKVHLWVSYIAYTQCVIMISRTVY